MGIGSGLRSVIAGDKIEIPYALTDLYPELAEASYRRGGLPVRIAGWALGMSTAEAITLWRTVFLEPRVPLTAELLLHELRHVHQFSERKSFPISYLWQSIRHGYSHNAYEIDARQYSANRLARNASDKDL